MNTKKPNPVQEAALTLKKAQTKQDIIKVMLATDPGNLSAAWAALAPSEQDRINKLCGIPSQPG